MNRKLFALMIAFVTMTFAHNKLINTCMASETVNMKIRDGKKLFLEANVALSKERFADAHDMAEKLIRDYSGDYQIGLYLHLYVHTFYFLDKDFRNGMLRPIPPGIKARIDTLKTRPDKDVIDLVKLAMLTDYLGGSIDMNYLGQILQSFPDSIWRDWAEWMLTQEKTLSLAREKYQDKSVDERSKLLMSDLYIVGKKFIEEHPNSYMVPKILKATADWGHWGGILSDDTAKQEAVHFCLRVLKDYPSAEYHCARSRQILRVLLGESYQEPEGTSEEHDRFITLFYCHTPQLKEYKKYTTEYTQMIEKEEAKTKPGLPPLSYVLIIPAVAIVIVGLILLLKKKPTSPGK